MISLRNGDFSKLNRVFRDGDMQFWFSLNFNKREYVLILERNVSKEKPNTL